MQTIIFLDHYKWLDTKEFKKCLEKKYNIMSLDPQVFSENKNQINIDIKNYKNFKYLNLSLWTICKSSVYDFLLKNSINNDSDLDVVKKYYDKCIQFAEYITKIFEKYKPISIVVEQGFQYDMRCAVEMARIHNIKTIAIENSFLKDYIFVDDSCGGICNRTYLSRNSCDVEEARILSEKEKNSLHDFFYEYKTQIPRGNKTLNIDSSKTNILLLGQVATDASITVDSHMYQDISVFINQCIEIISKNTNMHLFVRLHPKESWGNNHHGVKFNNLTLNKIKNEHNNVTIIYGDEIDTYYLMDKCDYAITLNSQSGLEFLYRKKPLLTAADAFYSKKGFTIDLSHPDLLEQHVQVLTQYKLDEDQKNKIDKFLYVMIFEYLWPKDFKNCKDKIRNLFNESTN